jgi:hypothetical protein
LIFTALLRDVLAEIGTPTLLMCAVAFTTPLYVMLPAAALVAIARAEPVTAAYIGQWAALRWIAAPTDDGFNTAK